MTVSVPGDLIRTYAGDGSTTAFSYPVRFDADDELIVILRDSDGNDTVKALGSDYTVSGEGNDAGGTVTFTTAPASGVTVVIYRSTEETQVVDLENASRNDAGAVELQLDRMVRMIQDHGADIDRSVKMRPGSDGITFPEAEDGKVLGWDGSSLANKTPVSIGADLLAGATGLDVLAAETQSAAVDALKDGIAEYWTFDGRTIDPDAPSSGIRLYTKEFGHGGLLDLWGRPAGMPSLILAPAPLDENLTLNVPTDYATINEAIEAWAVRPIKRGVVIDLNLASGYAIPEGVLLQDGDYGHFRITADDATVFLDAGFSGVPQQTSDTFEEGALFFGIRAEMPRLACLIDMNDVGGSGYLVALGSTGYIEGNCGVINSGKIGLYVKAGSHVPMAANCNFSGANWGNRVTTRSSLQAPTCNFSGTKQSSYGGSGTTANLDVSRGSVVYVTGSPGSESDLTGGVSRGLGVRRSFVSATSVDCSGNFDGAVIGAGSTVTLNGSFASNNSNHGVSAGEGATVDATGITATDNGAYNLYADAGAKIAARNSTLTGAGTTGVRAANGSTLVVNGSNCRRNGVSDQSTDIVCGEGSIIHAIGALGGTNTPVRAISTNGLIFKA